MPDDANLRSRPTTLPGRKPKWADHFIRLLGEGCTIQGAARELGIHPNAVYDYRKRHPEFADAWDVAYAQGTDLLEEEAQRRGVSGWDEPVFYQGEMVGAIRRYSDALLITML